MTSLGELRSTCRKCKTLTKKKKQGKGIEMLEYRVSVRSVDLPYPGNLDSDGVNKSKIFHCDGLFLCNGYKDSSRLVVWNSYLGQSCGIDSLHRWEKKKHKVWTFVNESDPSGKYRICEFDMHSLNSNSWNDFTREWFKSLKGNTYWYAQEQKIPLDERVGPRLPLPFHAFFGEQLAVLFQRYGAPGSVVKICITNNIEPNAVSWSDLFLAADLKPANGFRFSDFSGRDEEKKLPVGTQMSDLPIELEEELLSRLPVRCLGKLRSTCKKWNTLTKGESFCLLKKKQRKQRKQRKKVIEVLMLLDCRVSLMSVHVDLLCPTIERIGNLDAADGLNISKIFHCDGFYLCITKDKNELLVWNPHLGQARWIDPSKSYHRDEKYALGYGHDKEDKKVLRFVNTYDLLVKQEIFEFEMYSLKSSSWKMIDDIITPDWEFYGNSGLTLKGNTYWYAQQKLPSGSGPIPKDHPDFLISFDFTRESFGPRLPLPFHGFFGDTVTLSSVGEEQLAVLFQAYDRAAGTVIKIWITNKIEPDQVSWGNLLVAFVVEPDVRSMWRYTYFPLSFFVVDEDNKVAVVLFKMKDRNVAYVIGNNGYLKTVDLGEAINKGCFPLVCF
uniref:F-box/kelch-repeat protein n=1 Tax=Noccaea caerulescens TaxID=107243 RepID=A0A1J3JGI1_NOCCA